MKKVHRAWRLSPDVIRMIDEIVSFYQSLTPLGKITSTQVVEEAIQRLYAETIGNVEKKDS